MDFEPALKALLPPDTIWLVPLGEAEVQYLRQPQFPLNTSLPSGRLVLDSEAAIHLGNGPPVKILFLTANHEPN